MKTIENKTFGEERALYNLTDAKVLNCKFQGEEDGESALKECRDFTVGNCEFYLRYPLWHGKNFSVTNSCFTETCRAAMWYDSGAEFTDCIFNGIKAFRECNDVTLENCSANSPELGWKSCGITLKDGTYVSEYFMFDSRGVTVSNIEFIGKYSFQYTQDVEIRDSVLDTKDAFWHAKNVTVKNCVVKGEYLGWYSQNLTLINCKIIGTQPLCYCKNLTLVNCTTENCDLAFEYSDVNAEIIGSILSVKNPVSGQITADEIGETILENSVQSTNCNILIRKNPQK